MNLININVNNSHIAHGIRNTNEACPIALAAQEQIAGCDLAEVGPVDKDLCELVIWKPFADGVQTYQLPPEVTDFVRDFDSGKRVHPFTFQARRPD